MTCVSMILHTIEVKLLNYSTTPDTFNQWLIVNNGYNISTNNYIWESIKPLGYTYGGIKLLDEAKSIIIFILFEVSSTSVTTFF
jgi:hypothetical protein